MTVAISFLHEALPAVHALEWPLASVHAEVVMSIAELLEGVTAREAHESLVRSATSFILQENLGEAFGRAGVWGNHCLELLVSAFVNYF